MAFVTCYVFNGLYVDLDLVRKGDCVKQIMGTMVGELTHTQVTPSSTLPLTQNWTHKIPCPDHYISLLPAGRTNKLTTDQSRMIWLFPVKRSSHEELAVVMSEEWEKGRRSEVSALLINYCRLHKSLHKRNANMRQNATFLRLASSILPNFYLYIGCSHTKLVT